LRLREAITRKPADRERMVRTGESMRRGMLTLTVENDKRIRAEKGAARREEFQWS